MKITEEKLRALLDAEVPQTKSELRSYLGLSSFCGRSIYNLAGVSGKLWHLTKKGTIWEWMPAHQIEFDNLKHNIIAKALGYFDKEWDTILEVDASPIGVAAILCQINPNDRLDRKIIACWSQRFTETETRYSQVEKEALGVVLSCERFRMYLIGAKFLIKTDNKAVQLILGNPKSKPPLRIARWNLRLTDYDFTVEHVPGRDNMADYMSRHPVDEPKLNEATMEAENHVNMVMNNFGPRAVKLDEIIEEMNKDQEMIILRKAVIKGISNGQREFKQVFNDLTVTRQGILLKRKQIVIPAELRSRVTELAHEGHQGSVKTKNLLRSRIWYPGLDKAVDELCYKCSICAMNRKKRPEPVKMSRMDSRPWSTVSLDFHDLPNGNELLLAKDDATKQVIYEECKSTSAANVLEHLEKAISLMGIPKTFKTDNGPPFNGHEFGEFCDLFGIDHRKLTPLHPQANGQVEVFMRNINKIIKSAINGNNNWRRELNAFLRSYRSTPHTTTGVAPNDLMFQYSNASKLPMVDDRRTTEQMQLMRMAQTKNEFESKRMKHYADKRRRSIKCNMKVGDKVMYDQKRNKRMTNKYLNRQEGTSYTVLAKKGSMVTVKEESGRKMTRDISFFTIGKPPVACEARYYELENNSDGVQRETVGVELEPNIPILVPGQSPHVLVREARPKRFVKPIDRFGISKK